MSLMFARQPKRPPLTPIADVLATALTLCYRRAVPFIAAGVAGSFVSNVIVGIVDPEERGLAAALAWTVGAAAVTLAFLAPTTYLVARAMRGEAPTLGAAARGLALLGPRYFAIGLLAGLATIPFAISPFVAPIVVYALIRVSLAGAAAALENHGALSAIVRSWRLVEGRWWRTFALQLIVGIFAFTLLFGAGRIGALAENDAVTLAAVSLAQGVAAPLLAAVELLMFEEYRAADEQAEEHGVANVSSEGEESARSRDE